MYGKRGVDAWRGGATVTTLFSFGYTAFTEDTPAFNAMHSIDEHFSALA